jgi:hypothetical protein
MQSNRAQAARTNAPTVFLQHRISYMRSLLSVVFVLVASSSQLQASDAERLCDTHKLPNEIQSQLARDFANWKVQSPENLSQQAKSSWSGRKNPACPGIATGFFRHPSQSSFALLLVPSEHPDAAYRFVVFNPQPGGSDFEELVVEKSDTHGASNFYVQQVAVSKFFDDRSGKKFKVQAADAILMVDSAENEYEADVYFWSNGRFRQQWVDY